MKTFSEPLGLLAGEHFPHNSSLLVFTARFTAFIRPREMSVLCFSYPSPQQHLAGTNSGTVSSLEETDSSWQGIFLSTLRQALRIREPGVPVLCHTQIAWNSGSQCTCPHTPRSFSWQISF